MALLELVAPDPDWRKALGKALERQPGQPERRQDEPAPAAPATERRLSDDLAWLRQALDDPSDHGLREVGGTSAVAIWETALEDEERRLCRLRDRGVLEAAGFLLHESGGA